MHQTTDVPRSGTATPDPGPRPRILTHRERILLGQARRKQVKRQAHADWDPKRRKQEPSALLNLASRGRIPSLLALKEERMACSNCSSSSSMLPMA